MTDSAPPPSISGFPSNIRRPPPPSSHAFTNKDTDMIPLTRIPNLLQTLDLPSDGQVLTAFETGADSDQEEEDAEHSNEMVSRRNFLRVCAVLLGNESDSDEEEQEDLGSDGQAGSEASFAPSDNDDDDNEDAEYVQGGFEPDASQAQSQRTTRASRRRRGGAQDLAMLDDDVEEDEQGIQHATSAPVSTKRKKDKGKQKAGELSGVQKQRASELFTAFLLEGEEMEVTHSRSWEELSQRTLGFNEIRRVATRVSVSLTDAEVRLPPIQVQRELADVTLWVIDQRDARDGLVRQSFNFNARRLCSSHAADQGRLSMVRSRSSIANDTCITLRLLAITLLHRSHCPQPRSMSPPPHSPDQTHS